MPPHRLGRGLIARPAAVQQVLIWGLSMMRVTRDQVMFFFIGNVDEAEACRGETLFSAVEGSVPESLLDRGSL